MDPVQFDGVVRTLGQARSRRQAMRSLMGAAGALALGVRGASAQDEDCKANGKACKKNSQCCTNNCVGASDKTRGTCQTAQQTCPVGPIEDLTACPAECLGPDGAFPDVGGSVAPCPAC